MVNTWIQGGRVGFYFRKSFKCGPIRFNLSKSGIGSSIGVKGLPYGINAKGKEYIHAGRYNMYYRKQFNDSGEKYSSSEQAPVRPLNNSQKAVINLVIFAIVIVCIIVSLPDNSSAENVFKWLIYLYPTIQALWNRTEIFKSFLVNLFLGWTLIGWLYAFAWGIPKKYDITKSLGTKEIETITKAQKLLNDIKVGATYLKLLPEDAIQPIYSYAGRDFSKLSDTVIELLAEAYDNAEVLLKAYKKKLPPLRRQQAKVKGYKFARTKEAVRDNNLRGDALLRDEIFWEYFATDFDKEMRNR